MNIPLAFSFDGLMQRRAGLEVLFGALNIHRFFEHIPLGISCRKCGELGTMAGFARF
ncbi:hypothetical protein LZZ50_12510 [Xanthomonas arboricola]|uniref:hypothetical protein n=1 Tax=Xanthomonas arboricola TaxID=56448 RepID=UPI001FD6E96D|nr:hypothetical protein [Xanthomonas arboricola]UOS97386.1 hypothetical protein LZZ50_12510 [Xanthomonas arboricola]